ncbi:DUF6562 domain-containing protein [Bacteroides gallinarum]|uniref:DUF6562 domain-containing protein n=1 Tax=Bacteroides gallinarum TaxID=376806 RepID=UPI0003A6C020|nr:DUF6562 domain-containing protein [Bacteroides gallinarum]
MNRHLFFGVFAAVGMLLATSCSKDELGTNQSGGNEARMTFAIGLENGIDVRTRAISDGTSADKLVYAVYNESGELIEGLTGFTDGQVTKENAFSSGSLTENVTLTLAKGQTYTVAFWAQDADCKAYNTSDLTNITVDYTGTNNDETRDAFFKAETFTVTGDETINVTLKRPFAQINVGVTQNDWDAAVASGIEVKQSKVVIKNVATTINLLTGATSGSQEITYALNAIPEEELKVDTDNDGEKETYKWLSMSYILVADESGDGTSPATLESLEFTFKPETGNEIVFSEGLNSVPVQRNWRTNILGQILSSDVQFNIMIDPAYDDDNNFFLAGDAETLRQVAKTGGSVTLTENVTLEQPLVVSDGVSMEINLNGKNISNETGIWNDDNSQWSLIEVKGDLVIKGNGTLQAKENDCYAVDVKDGGKVIIEGGNYVGNISAVYVHTGTAEINGGTFSIQQTASAGSEYAFVINLFDKNRENGTASAVVRGGTFINFNPADCAAEGEHTNFVANGYSSVKVSNDPETYEVVKGVAVSSVENISDAITQALQTETKTIYTTAPLTFSKDTNIDGQGVAIEGSPVYFNGNATVKNMVFANGNNDQGKGSAVYVTAGTSKKITFEGCTFTNAEWDAIQLTDKDIESVTIKDCTFKNTVKGNRYIHLELRNGDQYAENASAKLTISGCTFENITKDYCYDSAITITGFKFTNMTLTNNTVKGAVPETLNSDVIWICDGNNFGSLMSTDDISKAFTVK